eukprot:710443-Amorphochlora_amoeboformis.AAC.1
MEIPRSNPLMRISQITGSGHTDRYGEGENHQSSGSHNHNLNPNREIQLLPFPLDQPIAQPSRNPNTKPNPKAVRSLKFYDALVTVVTLAEQ